MLNTVIHGDCLAEMQKIADKSIDMILCDLPYGTTPCKWDTVIPFEPLWEQYKRIIKDNGAIVLTASQPFTSKLIMSNLKMFKYEWIWQKHQATGFLNSKKMPLKEHENIAVFYQKQPTYNPQKTSGHRKVGSRKAKNVPQIQVYRQLDRACEYLDDGTRYPKTVQKIDSDKERYNSRFFKDRHPTQKPVALFEYLIKTYTNEGETILDNCAGSGTTAIACMNTNRNYILIEKEQEYIDVIEKRINEHRNLFTQAS